MPTNAVELITSPENPSDATLVDRQSLVVLELTTDARMVEWPAEYIV
jgi:hypothetical protein